MLSPSGGRSAAVSARNVGAAAEPDAGPASTRFAPCVVRLTASVPLFVTGEPETLNSLGIESATLFTVPAPRLPRAAGALARSERLFAACAAPAACVESVFISAAVRI